VRRRIDKPWTTVQREMDGMHMLGLLKCEEVEEEVEESEADRRKTKWLYSLADDFDEDTLVEMVRKHKPIEPDSVADRFARAGRELQEEGRRPVGRGRGDAAAAVALKLSPEM
jgi:hypothetical protein